jgi:hypothetical protein
VAARAFEEEWRSSWEGRWWAENDSERFEAFLAEWMGTIRREGRR